MKKFKPIDTALIFNFINCFLMILFIRVINTKNDFNRIFVIEDKNGIRYTCLKPDAQKMPKMTSHFKTLKAKSAPLNYLTPYFTGKRTK